MLRWGLCSGGRSGGSTTPRDRGRSAGGRGTRGRCVRRVRPVVPGRFTPSSSLAGRRLPERRTSSLGPSNPRARGLAAARCAVAFFPAVVAARTVAAGCFDMPRPKAVEAQPVELRRDRPRRLRRRSTASAPAAADLVVALVVRHAKRPG